MKKDSELKQPSVSRGRPDIGQVLEWWNQLDIIDIFGRNQPSPKADNGRHLSCRPRVAGTVEVLSLVKPRIPQLYLIHRTSEFTSEFEGSQAEGAVVPA